MGCNDPYLKALRSFGYNVIRLPKADMAPLQLLARNGGALGRIGDLSTVILPRGAVALPAVKRDTPAASLSGQRSGTLSVGVGLSVLGSIIGAMGGSKLGLDLAYKNARSVTFEFQDVLEDRIEVAALDQYLSDADVSPFSTHVGQLLEADQIYVTTATLKSNKIAVEARGAKEHGLDVSIPELKGVVGGNVKVGAASASASTVTFEGSLPLVFGFQAARLVYDGGRYQRFELLHEDRALEAAPRGALVGEAAFVRLSDS
jgi:hypothetical protein